jgi:predicted DNA-binding protein YlxM (UPF0122 family)
VRLTDLDKIKHFDAVLAKALGGRINRDMLTEYHADGKTIREIAELYGEPKSSVCNRLNRARTALRELGLMPADWECEKSHVAAT